MLLKVLFLFFKDKFSRCRYQLNTDLGHPAFVQPVAILAIVINHRRKARPSFDKTCSGQLSCYLNVKS